MIRQAVILAAGKGSRIRMNNDDLPKPLMSVAGLPLLKRAILTMGRAGIERVYVTVGFKAEVIRRALLEDPDYARAGIAVECIDNPDYEMGVGVSVLSIRDHVRGPFVLSMSDHVFDVDLVEQVARADMDAADLYLCVDKRLDEVFDMDDATKVKVDGDHITGIHKQLADYDAVDCGVFSITPKLFEHLEAAQREQGDCSLSDGVQRLAAEGRARVLDIGKAFWQDVDTPETKKHAEDVLFGRLRKSVDGPVARLINRRLSTALTRHVLVDTDITPNQMTVVANVIGFLGIYLIFRAGLAVSWAYLAAGAVLVQVQSILDGCDGELARLKFQGSPLGEWLDNVLDDLLTVAYCVALGWASAGLLGEPAYRWLGLAAAGGFVLYDIMLYTQLVVVHKSGNPFHFRWWFQKEDAYLSESLRGGASENAGVSVAALVHTLGRRDVYLFALMLLALVRLPQVGLAWLVILAAVYGGLSVVHVLAGGVRRRPVEVSEVRE